MRQWTAHYGTNCDCHQPARFAPFEPRLNSAAHRSPHSHSITRLISCVDTTLTSVLSHYQRQNSSPDRRDKAQSQEDHQLASARPLSKDAFTQCQSVLAHTASAPLPTKGRSQPRCAVQLGANPARFRTLPPLMPPAQPTSH